MKNIESLGEFGLINIIKKRFSANVSGKDIIFAAGDDCFCFKAGRSNICVTKDMLVEDVHFKKDWISAFDLGMKAVEVNVSDIASMGEVKPKYVFVGLACPGNVPVSYIKKLYEGMKKACCKYGAVIAGGDTVKSEKLVISVTVVGEGGKNIVGRNGAENGDFIGVTNTFGDSAAGLDLLTKYGAKYDFNKDQKYLISRHNLPQARLTQANKIAKHITAMTDASDGLYISVDLIAKAGEKGANIYIERIPLSEPLKRIFDARKRKEFALYGGEDFELVFTAPASKARLIKKLAPSVSYIGIINNSKKVKYFNNGKEEKTKYCGYKHF
ncbi:MAG: thiamine-phosphate kinase [Endomicrobium sp.]|jgi:thiamine-monophosphate kinase|nr:thiamine-phosphate kinase [Endomicrobium sp.]